MCGLCFKEIMCVSRREKKPAPPGAKAQGKQNSRLTLLGKAERPSVQAGTAGPQLP